MTLPCPDCGAIVEPPAIGHACSVMQTPEPVTAGACPVCRQPDDGHRCATTQYAAGSWVACAERMPAADADVLVRCGDGSVYASRWLSEYTVHDGQDDRVVKPHWEGTVYEGSPSNVTHWAPIYAPVVAPVAP